MKYLIEFADVLLKSEAKARNRVRPCSKRDIEQLEMELGVEFPEAYREFLLLCGRNAGDFLRGSEYRFDEVVANQQMLIDECNAEGMAITWPNDSFVFASHQGYSFCLFRVNGDPNPPVLIVSIDDYVKETGTRFAEFMLGALEDELRVRRASWELQKLKAKRRAAEG